MKRQRLLVVLFASMAMAGWSGDTEIIVESFTDGYNSQGFSQPAGKWSPSATKSTAAGLKGTKTLFNTADAEAATARYTPTIPVAGKYEVFITYPSQGNATDIKYNVVSADGAKEIVVTQNGRALGHVPPANQWYSLGVFTFNAGAEGYVELSDPLTGAKPLANEPNARIYADAIKLVPQGITLPADYVNVVGSGAGSAAPAESAALQDLPAVTAPDGGLPVLPSGTPVVVAAATPAASASTPATAAVTALPTLPATTVPATASTATLPDLPAPAAPAPGLPSLPATTVNAAPGLPALPAATTPGAPGLPALPAATADASTALPALPAATADPAAGLPALPATAAEPAPGLPGLPSAPATGLPELPPATVAAEVTPIPTPDLPSLAPVTPTPDRMAPRPSDTPVGGAVAGLPGGPLNNLPPMPGPGMPELPTGPAVAPPPALMPAPPAIGQIPGAAPAPGMAVVGTPAAQSANMSITQYNPSNLQWMYDFGAALNTARAQNKKVLVFFTASGNQTAKVYETQYFMDPSVRQALNNYVLMKVDFPKNTRLGYTLGIFGAGIIVVTDGTGNVTSRIEQIPATPMDLIKQMAQAKIPVATPTPGPAATAETTGTAPAAAPVPADATPSVPAPPAAPGVPAAP